MSCVQNNFCTYNLAFKHVHGSLIRRFVSFDKNAHLSRTRYLFVGEIVSVSVCACSKLRHQQPTRSCTTKPQNHLHTHVVHFSHRSIALLFQNIKHIGVLTYNTSLYVCAHQRHLCETAVRGVGRGHRVPSLSSFFAIILRQ